ncbi:MAG: MBL fold metallo-hydrolase [Pseudomonadales bacterium]|nr:MBL fold metallo-hydrolase [Pseudomonadales bacterium]
MTSFFEICHHGAVNGVTGSCHELRLRDGPGMLVDCGLFQGAETSGSGADAATLKIDFPIEHIQALVVSHVHIDHVGRIPYLLAAGFRGPIICTEPSARLLPLVLEDAMKMGVTRDRRQLQRFVDLIAGRIVALPYGRWQQAVAAAGGSIAIRFQPAGHILGSAYVECEVKAAGEQHRVVFSGDLGAPHAPLLPAPRSPYKADTLVIESTYGDRLHQGRRERSLQLKKVVERALRDDGAVLIPAFSIGRTQEILYEIEGLIHRHGDDQAGAHRWRDLEIIVDSPLAAGFTRVYRELRPYWDAEALGRVRAGRHPLAFEQLYTVGDHAQHQRAVNYIKQRGHPCVVIAASGMCAGGRMVNYLKALIGDPRTDILFIGYQAAGTPGRAIQRHGPQGGWVELDGQRFDIRAGVYTISGYSAHADQHNLVNFVRRMRVKPRQIRIVHGDDDAKAELQRQYRALLPTAEVSIPTG